MENYYRLQMVHCLPFVGDGPFGIVYGRVSVYMNRHKSYKTRETDTHALTHTIHDVYSHRGGLNKSTSVDGLLSGTECVICHIIFVCLVCAIQTMMFSARARSYITTCPQKSVTHQVVILM